MPLQIAFLEENDIPAFADVDDAAMEHWGLAKAMVVNSPISRREMVEGWIRKGFNEDSLQTYLKVTDDKTDEIIACALWRIQPEESKSEPEKELPAPAEAEGVESDETKKPGVTAVGQAMGKVWKEFQSETFGTSPHANLQILVTHPKHQGRGAGSMLVEWGCQRADERGLISVLMASQAGLKLYERNGFELKKTIEMDLQPFGVDETEIRRGVSNATFDTSRLTFGVPTTDDQTAEVEGIDSQVW